jgi:hypothetical protein
MEDNPPKKAEFTEEEIIKTIVNLPDEQKVAIFQDSWLGNEEESAKMIATALFKNKEFEEKFGKIVNEKFLEYRERFYKLSIPDEINFIINNQFYNMVTQQMIIYALRSLIEGQKDSDEYIEAFRKQFFENIEKDLESNIDNVLGKQKEKKEDKNNSE